MGKFFVLLFSTLIIYSFSFGQGKYALQGLVVDENNQPLKGASVTLYPGAKGLITDDSGYFMFNKIKKGKYIVTISFIGYRTKMDTLLIHQDIFHTVNLKTTSLNMPEVEVTDNSVLARKKEEPLSIEIVNDNYMKQNMGGNLMKSLERLPGVSTIDIGQGQSKPVIRGLGFNRVAVVENSIKHESQQWGADHGLEIDQYSVQNIEIIKGPASLRYGSEAIGGVVEIKTLNIPAENTVTGSVDLSAKTNNDFLGTSISLNGRKKWFFAGFRATMANYGDYKVPTDSVDIYSYRAPLYKNHLRNTAGQERNLHLDVGIIRKKFQSTLYISNINNINGFFANAHGLEPRNVNTVIHDKSSRDINYPYHQVNHFKIINTGFYQLEKLQLKTGLGFQQNIRQEWSQYVSHGYMPPVFPATSGLKQDLELGFNKSIYTGNLNISYILDRVIFDIGLNSEYQDNQINGRTFIIPEFTQYSSAGYAYTKYSISARSIIHSGIRYDYGNLRTKEYFDWFASPVFLTNDTTSQYLNRAKSINRDFSNFSWSFGYNFNPKKWSLKINIGKSFRMPIAKELAANGINYHHFSYEIGNADLAPESSYQLDAGIEYNAEQFTIGINPFLNYFANYLYLNPSPQHDWHYGNGNQVYFYTQSAVFRYGGEIHAQYQLTNTLQSGIIGEYVYSEQLTGEKKGFTLPFAPPASLIFNIRYQKQKAKFRITPYFFTDYKLTTAQKNIVPPEEITKGFQVVNIGFGSEIKMKNQKMNISLQIQNLLNNKYYNHVSYYRLINVPEPGRNLVINISIPLSMQIK